MIQRLSIRHNIFEKVLLAIFIWVALLLPTPIGLFEYLTIKTNSDLLNITQRVIQLGICLYASFYFYKDKIVVEYDDSNLIVTDKRDNSAYKIPFNNLLGISSSPGFVRPAVKTYTYKVRFLDMQGSEANLKFTAYYGKRIRCFKEAVKSKNPGFSEN